MSALRLNSLGGLVLEGAKLASIIQFAKIATVVVNRNVCASACFMALASGYEKFASYAAQIGIHGVSERGQETTNAAAATVEVAKIYKSLGVPPSVIGKMVITPPSEVVWLAPDELRTMGVTMTGKPHNLRPLLTSQQKPPASRRKAGRCKFHRPQSAR